MTSHHRDGKDIFCQKCISFSKLKLDNVVEGDDL